MKKVIVMLLCLSALFFASCASDESDRYIKEQENEMNKAMEEIKTHEPEVEESEEDDIFILRNNTGRDIYCVEFSSPGKENLLIDAVLPSGNEVKIKNSGVWEIKAEFLSEDGSYYYESFGSVDLNYNGANSIVILSENENGFVIEKAI